MIGQIAHFGDYLLYALASYSGASPCLTQPHKPHCDGDGKAALTLVFVDLCLCKVMYDR